MANDSYWSLVDPIWEPLNRSWQRGPKAFVRKFRSVNPIAANLYAAHLCQCEVCNGGFHQFFWNSTGILAPEALAAFRAIGMSEWAELLAEAITFFGDTYPREWAERQDRLDEIPRGRRREDWDPFYHLDKRFYEFTDRWEEMANAYSDREA